MSLQKFIPFVVELLVELLIVDDAHFPMLLMDVERKVVVELLKVHSLVVRSCSSTVIVHIFVANFLLNNSLLSMLS